MLLTPYMLLDILILLTCPVLFLYLYTSRKCDYWKKRGIPYLEPVPFVGSLTEVLLKFNKSLGVCFQDIHASTKKPYIGIFITDKPALVIRHPDLIKSILVKDFDYFYDRSVDAHNKHDTLGSQILFLMKNPDWSTYRRKITPAFTSGKIKSMYHLFEKTREELNDYTSKQVEKSEIVECKDLCIRYTTELITSTAFGLKANCFEDDNSKFREAARRIFDFNNISRAIATTCYIIAPALVKLFRMNFVDAESASFLREIFWKTIKIREESNTKRNDFIDILIQIRKSEFLEKNYDFDGEKMLAQATMFFLAGYETTSTIISFALYELAKYPEIQKKLREELEEFSRTQGELTYEAILNHHPGLKYLDMVFKETTRIYPSLPFLDRVACQDYQIPGTNDTIEKGTGCYISLLGLHMDPENFPNPDEFIPERFSEENKDNIKPYTFMPFGEGPRSCLGIRFGIISSKNAIADIISNFEVNVLPDTPKKIEFHPKGFTLCPRSGSLPLRLTKIKH